MPGPNEEPSILVCSHGLSLIEDPCAKARAARPGLAERLQTWRVRRRVRRQAHKIWEELNNPGAV